MDTEVKKHIKAFAAVCSMAMVFGLFSAAAFADEPSSTNINQTYINNNGGKLPEAAGNYVLAEDISVSETAQIGPSGASVTLDLAGHKITYSGTGSMYIVGKTTINGPEAENVSLTINDSSATGSGLITVSDDYVGGGSKDYWISSSFCTETNANDERGGCILLQYGCSFTLNGGTINGFHAGDEGGAVHVTNGSHFYMTGGTIQNCSAKSGGAVAVHASSKGRTAIIGERTYDIVGTAEITGGTITGNTATDNGGGVRIFRSDVLLSNCVITNNTTRGTGSNGGGGVCIFNTEKGDPHVTLKGNVQIYGNHATNGTPDKENLYFMVNKTITLVGDLDSSSQIHFGAASWNRTHEYFKADGVSCDLGSFICDNSSVIPYYNSSKKAIMATVPPKITGYNVLLDGSIVFVPTIDLQSYADADSTVTYSYEYTKEGKGKTTVNETVPFNKLTKKSGTTYTLAIPVESACMTAPITITVNYGTNGDSISDAKTVESYAKAIINGGKTYTDAQKDAAKALLIYGGYAQKQLKINANKLPTVSGVDFSSNFDGGLVGAAYTPGNDAFYAGNVSFLSQTEVKLAFKKSVLGDEAPTMTVSYGSSSTETISATPNGGYYVYTVKGPNGNGFSATQFANTFDYSVGNVSGTYSVETYLKAVKASGTTSTAMKNLAEAYNNFAQKCKTLAQN